MSWFLEKGVAILTYSVMLLFGLNDSRSVSAGVRVCACDSVRDCVCVVVRARLHARAFECKQFFLSSSLSLSLKLFLQHTKHHVVVE